MSIDLVCGSVRDDHQVQGYSESQRELLDVESTAGHLLRPDSVFGWLAQHRRERHCCVRHGGVGQAVLMRRCQSRVSALRSSFAGFRFPPEVITVAVRWYLRYPLSYRDIEELLAERGIEVDHVTVYRWVQRFTPLLVGTVALS